MRKHAAKIVTSILFGMLILSFAVWGIGDIFRSGGRLETVAEVGRSEIDVQLFSRRLAREASGLQQRLNTTLNGDQIRAFGLPQQVLRDMIVGTLLDEQAAEMGLVVSDEEIKRRIVETPLFHDATGSFDKALFARVLSNNGMSEASYVADLRNSVKREQLGQAVISGALMPRDLLEEVYSYREERRIAEMIVVPSGDGSDLPEPDEAQLQTAYEDFADRFQAPEYREVTLLELRAEDVMDEIAISEEELAAEFDVRRDEFVVPERRSLQQLLFDEEGQARSFKSAVDGGQDFAETAIALAEQAPVVMTAVSRADLSLQAPELAEAVFALKPEAIGGPIESPFGWHVVRLTAIEEGLNPELADVREELREEIARRHAVDSLVSLANELDDELAGGANLEEAAGQLGLETRSLAAVDRRGRDYLATSLTLPKAEGFLASLFSAAVGDDGVLSETPDGGYYIFRVDGVTPATTRPFEEVRDQVATVWRQETASAAARERAEALSGRANEGATLSGLGESEGLNFTTTAPIDRFGAEASARALPEMTAQLFEMGLGEVFVANAPGGWVVAKLTEIRPGNPNADAEALGVLEASLTQGLQNDLLNAFTSQLERDIGVRVNQAAVDQALSIY